MTVGIVLMFNLIILFLTIDLHKISKIFFEMYYFLQVPISIFAGFLVAKYFEFKRLQQKKTKQKILRNSIADLIDFLYIYVENIINGEGQIKNTELEDIKEAQQFILTNLKYAQSTLDVTELTNLEYMARGNAMNNMIKVILMKWNILNRPVSETVFKKNRKVMLNFYKIWLDDIQEELSRLRTHEWDSGLKQMDKIMDEVLEDMKNALKQ